MSHKRDILIEEQVYCLNCGQSFEKLVRSAAAITEVICPTCGQPHVQKKMSMFASTNKGDRSLSALSSSAGACAPGGT